MLKSDFSTVRMHLEIAGRYLYGSDEISNRVREAIDILAEAIITAEYSRGEKKVIPFKKPY